MNKLPDSYGPGPEDRKWYNRISLNVKITVLTVLIGLFLWALMDYIQSNRLKQIFYVQLLDTLSEQSMEYRLNFDQYIRSFHETAELIISRNSFRDYIHALDVSADDDSGVLIHSHKPPWFPKSSILRVLSSPRYAFLLGQDGKAREFYTRRKGDQPPASLFRPGQLLLAKSLDQSLITRIGEDLLLVTSEPLEDPSGKTLAYLMLASPIDEEFINVSLGTIHKEHYVALLSPGKEPRVIVSSDETSIPPGTKVEDLKNSFLITGQEYYDYGSAEFIIKLASLVSLTEVDKITDTVISTGRHQRNIIAPVFILTFTVIMVLVTRRINRLNKKMADFSIKTLGINEQKTEKGDQLYSLEKQFARLTDDVIKARAILKREADEKTRLIVNNAFDAIITLDADGVITTWNPKAEGIFGWPHEHAVGQKASDLIFTGAGRESIDYAIKNYIETGNTPDINKQIRVSALYRGEKEFPVEFTISPASLKGHYYFIAIIRDITERKRFEDELRESREKYSKLLETAKDAIFIADIETGNLVDVNRSAEALTGKSREELIGMNHLELHPEEFRDQYSEFFRQGVSQERSFFYELYVINTAGKHIPVEISTNVIESGGKKIIQGIFRDVTERKESEDKIKSSLREKEVLLKEIHHRVKNNMQVISSLLNLQSEYIKDTKYHEMFNESQNRIKSMALVHEKLYRSQDFANIDFRDYIGSLTKSLFMFYGSKAANIMPVTEIHDINLTIDTAIPCGLILNELISNSLKHAFPGNGKGEIKVVLKKSERDDFKYELSVSDDGIGIPEDLDIRKTKTLGLQLVTNLAERQLQGRLDLYRTGSTTFIIYFNDIFYKKRT